MILNNEYFSCNIQLKENAHSILVAQNGERMLLFVWLIMCPPSVLHLNGKEK